MAPRHLSSAFNGLLTPKQGPTGSAVEWSLTESQHGWYHLGHPASSKRLRHVYNNSNFVATYSMVANTITTDDVQWRFIVALPQSAWSGVSDNSWTTAGNWVPSVVPSTGDAVNFDSSSTTNLSTLLNL